MGRRGDPGEKRREKPKQLLAERSEQKRWRAGRKGWKNGLAVEKGWDSRHWTAPADASAQVLLLERAEGLETGPGSPTHRPQAARGGAVGVRVINLAIAATSSSAGTYHALSATEERPLPLLQADQPGATRCFLTLSNRRFTYIHVFCEGSPFSHALGRPTSDLQ